MSPSRLLHNIAKIPITSTAVLILGNYELWRIHKGVHPYWSPKLEKSGIMKKQKTTSEASEASDNGAVQTKGAAGGESRRASIQWMNLNGVPIPFIAPKSVD